MTSTRPGGKCSRIIGLSLLLVTGGAWAGDLQLEWDFQNPQGRPSRVPAKCSKVVSNLFDSATFSVGPNPGLAMPFFDAALQKGSMKVGHGTYQGLCTVDDPNLPGEDNSWRAYMQCPGGFVPTTIAVAFKPGFAGMPTNVHVLVSVSGFNGGHCIALFTGGDGGTTGLHTGSSGPHGNSAAAYISKFKWDKDTWYFVAGSFEQSKKATFYLRPLTGQDTKTARFAVSDTVVNDRQTGPTNPKDYSEFSPGADGKPDWSGPSTEYIRVGGTPIFYASGTDDYGADGTFALVRFYKRYIADPKGFEDLFKTWRKM